LSTIANSDRQDEYPNLLDLLARLHPCAMQAYTEFVKTDLMEDELLPIVRTLLAVLVSMSILSANELSPAPVYRIHSS
jgi:hypothetical protein